MADIHILVPVYNDWAAVRCLLDDLDRVAADRKERIARARARPRFRREGLKLRQDVIASVIVHLEPQHVVGP